MRQLRALWHRLAGLWRKDRSDRELNAELESHVEMHTAENLRRGISREEARRQALVALRHE
jgi:putative ABC transport system permease protein